MFESPLIREILAQARHRDILQVLEIRFGPIPPDLARLIQTVEAETKLDKLVDLTVGCPDLETFRIQLAATIGRRNRAVSRRNRRRKHQVQE